MFKVQLSSILSIFLAPFLCVLMTVAVNAQSSPALSEFQVNTFTAGNQGNTNASLSIAANTSGDKVVVWPSDNQDGSSEGVFAQRYDNTGANVGLEFQVNTTTANDQKNPYVAIDNAGNFIITWESNLQDGDSGGIFAQLYDNTGATVGTEFQVNSTSAGNQIDPTVGMDSSGNFVIVWQTTGSVGVFAQRYTNTGSTIGGEFKVNSGLSGAGSPRIGMNQNGDFVIVYTYPDSDSNGIFGQMYDNSGATIGSQFQVNTFETSSQSHPKVDLDDLGNFVVSWNSFVQDPDASAGVYAQRFSNTGAPLGSEFSVATTTIGFQGNSDVSVGGSGEFVITWNGPDASSAGVYAQEYDNSGAPIGTEFQVNTHTAGNQWFPVIAKVDSINYTIIWVGSGQDGSLNGVIGQSFGIAVDTDSDGVPDAIDNCPAVTNPGQENADLIPEESIFDVFLDPFPAGSGSFQPNVAFDTSDNVYVVASCDYGSDLICLSILDNDGNITYQDDSLVPITSSRFPWVQIDSNNDLYITYSQDSGSGSTIGAKKIDSSGSQLIAEAVIVSEVGHSLRKARTVMDDQDRLHMIFADNLDASNNYNLFYQSFDTNLNPIISKRQLNTSVIVESKFKRLRFDIAIDPDDNVHVVWRDSDWDYLVYSMLDGDDGTDLINDTNVTQFLDEGVNSPDMVVDSNGVVHIAYQDYSTYNRAETFITQLTPLLDDRNGDAALFGTIVKTDMQLVSNAASDKSPHPGIAVDSENNLHVVWSDTEYGNYGGTAYTKLDNNLNELVPQMSMSPDDTTFTLDTTDPLVPKVAVDSNNKAHVVWADEGAYDVYYANFLPGFDDGVGDACSTCAAIPVEVGSETSTYNYYPDEACGAEMGLTCPAGNRLGACPVDHVLTGIKYYDHELGGPDDDRIDGVGTRCTALNVDGTLGANVYDNYYPNDPCGAEMGDCTPGPAPDQLFGGDCPAGAVVTGIKYYSNPNPGSDYTEGVGFVCKSLVGGGLTEISLTGRTTNNFYPDDACGPEMGSCPTGFGGHECASDSAVVALQYYEYGSGIGADNVDALAIKCAAIIGGGDSCAAPVLTVSTSSRTRIEQINKSANIYLGSKEAAVLEAARSYLQGASSFIDSVSIVKSLGFHGSALSDHFYQSATGGEDSRVFSDDAQLLDLLPPSRQHILNLLDLLKQMGSLYGFMQSEDTQLLSYSYRISESSRVDFMRRNFLHLVGEKYFGIDTEFRDDLSKVLEIVVEWEKAVVTNFGKICYDKSVIDYMTELDYPGSLNWFHRYKEKSRDWVTAVLGEQADTGSDFVDWLKVDDKIDDPLKAYYQYVFGYCLSEAIEL
jgi:hypothetical protein